MAPTSAVYSASADTNRKILDNIESQFRLDPDALKQITRQFLQDIRLGLGEYNHPMAMIPTFVTGVPDGTETGTFLALDLGGTNLRVCEVRLLGNKNFSLRQQKYRVSETLKTGEATALFDYLADSVDSFLTEFTGGDSPTEMSFTEEQPSASLIPPQTAIPLGLTFSFPVEQTALNQGKILTWTKGFSAKNAVGHDVVRLLQDAFDRKHLHVKCVALVNDTVGALLSRAYTTGGCVLGSIFGTGTNGAYVEKVHNITKLGDSPARAKGGDMIVNTEWGAFNNTRTALPSTPYDNKLDRESINPRLQAFEKFISGMYLGEITRNVLLSLIDAAPRPLLFNGKSSDVLNAHYGLDTAVMSEVEEAWETGRPSKGAAPTANGAVFSEHFIDIDALSAEDVARLERIRGIVSQRLSLSPADVSLRDAAIVRWASFLVADRAAKLSGCAIAALLAQTGRAELSSDFVPEEERIPVGVDGSLIQFYPNFNAHLRESLRSLVGEEVERRVEIGMARDGSGVGAALCALQAIKQDL
ncbi:Glucokinase [Sparassis crispa]|uniref:Phosphotransferase n=1 Tax=Sparassis crispa TaxID=139825 RepID=A0A401GAH8_9APHY|nr:Glucokinase [Sparassis crispa]GBE79133.1 Glucokinase [Sparassis crispa]